MAGIAVLGASSKKEYNSICKVQGIIPYLLSISQEIKHPNTLSNPVRKLNLSFKKFNNIFSAYFKN